MAQHKTRKARTCRKCGVTLTKCTALDLQVHAQAHRGQAEAIQKAAASRKRGVIGAPLVLAAAMLAGGQRK